MNKEEFLKAIMELPKVETDTPISAYRSINVDDLISAVDRLNKVPTYDELLRENKKQKEANGRADVLLEFMPKIKQLQQENKQLKDNWNKLREWIVYNKHNENTEQHYLVVDYGTLLGKMQELEQGSDSNDS